MATTSDASGFLKSTFPVLFPWHRALDLPQNQFEEFLATDLEEAYKTRIDRSEAEFPALGIPQSSVGKQSSLKSGTATVKSSSASTWAEVTRAADKIEAERKIAHTKAGEIAADEKPSHPFMRGLLTHGQDREPPHLDNKMLTENADVAYHSAKNALVDLFFELEDVVSTPRLDDLLNAAWDVDSLSALKIIFNARSIHLGKSSRMLFYRCVGWLAAHHPLTCLINLKWLSRPTIEKKVEKKEQDDDDMVLVEEEKDDNDPSKFDIRNGVAHGYYKDLLNLLALAVNDMFNSPRDLLNIEQRGGKDIVWDEDSARAERHAVRDSRHKRAIQTFNGEAFYRGLHITVARIFAEQLAIDMKLLRSGDKKKLQQISLCAKWAPSSKLFHDKHTFIVTSIAELLHPRSLFKDIDDREEYLRRARESYRKDIASLRKALMVVERDISAEKFDKIKYETVPSLAMNQYSPLFARKDIERFDQYLQRVAAGKSSISGATLLPSTLVQQARVVCRAVSNFRPSSTRRRGRQRERSILNAMRTENRQQYDVRVLDGQWKVIVQRIKDSGTMESSMAVCDVSGSMNDPIFPDGSCPMDSAIGLSLLLAEIVQPPFGGAFITFSRCPRVQAVDLSKSFHEKVEDMLKAHWNQNTNFTAVFEDLILPMAWRNKVEQKDMVKRVFVFSDMQFDTAEKSKDRWSTSFERIKDKFEQYGYEVPELVFWNLAGGRAQYGGASVAGNAVAPKPVTVGEHGTSLVSGYSQGLLKVFLDGGSFEVPADDGDQLVEKEYVNEEGDEITIVERKKQETTPLTTVMKAISHQAYSMLTVAD